MDLTDIHRTFCSVAVEYTFLLGTHGTFSGINHVYQIITLCILSLYNVMYKLYLSKLGEKISLLIWCLENFKEV